MGDSERERECRGLCEGKVSIGKTYEGENEENGRIGGTIYYRLQREAYHHILIILRKKFVRLRLQSWDREDGLKGTK